MCLCKAFAATLVILFFQIGTMERTTCNCLREIMWQEKEKPIVKFLKRSTCNLLCKVTQKGDLKSLREIISQEKEKPTFTLDIACCNCTNRSPLMHTAERNHPECMKELLAAGASQRMYTIGFYECALRVAARHGSLECVKILIETGEDVNFRIVMTEPDYARPCDFGTDRDLRITTEVALMEACLYTKTECVKELLKSNALVNIWRVGDGGYDLMTEEDNEIKRTLFAAGDLKIRVVLKDEDLLKKASTLKELCRELVRDHLLALNRQVNLFQRVPKLGLPPLLVKYMLYYVSL